LVGFFFIISETKGDTTEPDRSEFFLSPEETLINAEHNQVPTPSESISVEVGTSYESNQARSVEISSPTIQPEIIQVYGNDAQSSDVANAQPVSYNTSDPEPTETTDEDGYINPADALLKFNRTVYNFGTIRDGAKASTLFVFTNIGTEPLEIEVVSACFCMSIDHTIDLIQNGEKGNIDVVFDSNDQVGNVKKDIDVIFKNVDKDGYPLVKRLTIKGKVLPR
jgi:Protein of unknown function (DUF1573)